MAELAPLVLCVDDNERTRYALTRTLQRAGFRTLEAATGTEALNRMGDRPDVVVLDVHLPDLSGYAVCQRIKADPQTASTPVLQISADFVEVEHRARGLELGADAYLAHPVEPPEPIATIRALLRARRAEEQARANARELQRAAEEREQLVNEVQIADRRKDEFLAMLAHELRNPLAALTSGLQVLDGLGSQEPKARQTRATLLRQLGVLTRLVDDLLDVARRIRAAEAGSSIMLVALTGYGRPEDRERALQSGFDAHLVKPVDLDELNHLLAELGRHRQAGGQA
jgi:CheY-like chemotaxis protein